MKSLSAETQAKCKTIGTPHANLVASSMIANAGCNIENKAQWALDALENRLVRMAVDMREVADYRDWCAETDRLSEQA